VRATARPDHAQAAAQPETAVELAPALARFKRKRFFFEKKKQKTFTHLRSAVPTHSETK
jgi:hypothetical protein